MLPALAVAIGLPFMGIYLGLVLLTLDMESVGGQYALIVPVSYLLGATPWGFLLTHALVGGDITRYGSGKTGTANVLRTAGGKLAVVVLALDASKGALGVGLAWAVAGTGMPLVAAGLAAIVGHNWSVYLGFKGGRGVATGVGGLLVMEPVAGALALALFLPVVLLSRYFSLGSVTGVTVAFLATLVLALVDQSPYTYLLYTGPGGAIIIWQHRGNIRRLLHGTERRLGQPAEEQVGSSADAS